MSGGRSGAGAGGGEATAELTELELRAWAFEVGRVAVLDGVFVCLTGELGAGKSTLARAACRGAGVRGPVPSPTFTLIHRHQGSGGSHVHHADLYRVETAGELHDVGWSELLRAEGAVFVEWAERAAGQLPPARWEIHLDMAVDPMRRRVSARAVGDAPPVPEFSVEAN